MSSPLSIALRQVPKIVAMNNLKKLSTIFNRTYVYHSKFHSKLTSSHVPVRFMSDIITLSDSQLKKKIDGISDKFSEAMVSLDDAKSSVDTVYFSEDAQEAQEIVQETLGDFDILLKQLNEDQQKRVINTIGLKMKELEAQLKILNEMATD